MRALSFEPGTTVRMPRFVWEEGELEIIGPVDTRRCIVNTRAFPFRFICHLYRPHPSPCSGRRSRSSASRCGIWA